MEPMREFGKFVILAGILLMVLGGLLAFGGKLPFRLGRLPGDIVYEGRNSAVYFPIVTCLLLSVILSAILWLAGTLKK